MSTKLSVRMANREERRDILYLVAGELYECKCEPEDPLNVAKKIIRNSLIFILEGVNVPRRMYNSSIEYLPKILVKVSNNEVCKIETFAWGKGIGIEPYYLLDER